MSEPALSEKIAFLSQPAAYPDEGTLRVGVKETHMSFVFLTDHNAWKLKKPVRYDYLDFSTVEARRENCRREIELNRRLAPGVYMNVVALVADEKGNLRIGGPGRNVDWLVKMRRLPEARMLDVAIRARTVQLEDIARVGALLADFYLRAKRISWSPAEYRSRLETEIQVCTRELHRPEFGLPPDWIDSIQAEQLGALTREAAMFDGRVSQGRIVDAHGDLRPEHVCLVTEPVIIDCLEFNPDFRILDPVSELSFFALECERLGGGWIGNTVLDIYQQKTGDRPPAALLSFYRRQHAMLRAKIAAWHIRDSGVSQPGKWIAKAKDYLERAISVQQAR